MSVQKLIIGNSLEVLTSFEDESVDLCVTSPPYWNVRDYGSENANYVGWSGQLGLEESHVDYIDHLCCIFDEVKRVLKKTGSCWVNIGDTFKDKMLLQIPSRFSIEMCNRGWILRNECIWQKPNVMPIPTKDRFTMDFEKFYFFTKEPNYYFKQQLEPLKQPNVKSKFGSKKDGNYNNMYSGHTYDASNLEGRNKRAVWTIPTRGSDDNHAAMFPMELIETPIKACCPNNGVVLDPFCGSGTTLEYCRKHDLDGIGIEINPIYKAIIERKSMMDVGKLEDFA